MRCLSCRVRCGKCACCFAVSTLSTRRYTELAALIDPNKTPKTDRNLILDDAVRVITQLRVENNQLRQLNKLLEERVQEQEAPRGQALYQSYLMSQGGLQPPSRVDGASTSNLMGVPGEYSHQTCFDVCLILWRCLPATFPRRLLILNAACLPSSIELNHFLFMQLRRMQLHLVMLARCPLPPARPCRGRQPIHQQIRPCWRCR